MIYIERVALTAELEGKLEKLTQRIQMQQEDLRVATARRTWRSNSGTRQSIRNKLDMMTQGISRCMFCGDNEGSDIDHFDPLSRTPLRTFDWLNHLLSCSICNSHQKRDQFPVDSSGNPLLIDPTKEDPFDHLVLTLTLGEYQAVSEKGQKTLDVCKLNRPPLTRGRMQARRVVALALRDWNRSRLTGDADGMDEALLTVIEQPFADVYQAMLRQAVLPMADVIFRDLADLPAILSNPELRAHFNL